MVASLVYKGIVFPVSKDHKIETKDSVNTNVFGYENKQNVQFDF